MSKLHIFHNLRLAETYVVGPSHKIEAEYGNASELPYTFLTLADGGEYIACDGFVSLEAAKKRANRRAQDQREIHSNRYALHPENDAGFYEPLEELNAY